MKHIPNTVAREVFHQMVPDFPGQAIEWVKHTPWIGPRSVPLGTIDTANRANWVASHEPDRVKEHMDLIRQGKSKPIILGKLPNHNKLFIIDAHHRFLAYEAMGLNPVAYVGMIAPEDMERAMTAHSKQFTGASRLNGT